MIPKIIHYVWIGDNEKPLITLNCIKSWKQFFPGYEFKEWNVDNWPLESNAFAFESYKKHKYAFASDVIRLDVLIKYGGIYLDTDVLVHRSFDDLLSNSLFLGMMYNNAISTAVIGVEPRNPVIKKIRGLYDDVSYMDMFSGKFDATNNGTFTRFFIDNYPEFELANKKQRLNDGTIIFPKEYFEYPSLKKSVNYSEHLFMKSWSFQKVSHNVKLTKGFLKKILGKYIFGKISSYRGQRRYKYYSEYYRKIRAKNEG